MASDGTLATSVYLPTVDRVLVAEVKLGKLMSEEGREVPYIKCA